MRSVFVQAMHDAHVLLQQFMTDPHALDALATIATELALTLTQGRKALVCGNGGSMADAVHFAEEWTGRFRADRRPLGVLALSDAAAISCIANDYGFEHVFSRQVEALGNDGDLLFVLSTSGMSQNLVRAAKAGKVRAMKVIGFLGRDGGELLSLCDVAVVAPGATSDRIQELHMLALHALIEAVEKELGVN